jgi:nitroimidazol reductase NimA-like FMN-containing flavoprotein (pyridoxamine 5'-phosphate oxidase superfamily)
MTEQANEAVLEWLHRDECLALLTTVELGRLAVVSDGEPLVVPVNFTYEDGSVVIHTDEGTKLASGSYSRAALEADQIDPDSHEGWSVLVRGRAYEITDALDARSERLRQLPKRTWAPGRKSHLLMIDAEQVTGRRLRAQRHLAERPERLGPGSPSSP